MPTKQFGIGASKKTKAGSAKTTSNKLIAARKSKKLGRVAGLKGAGGLRGY